MADELLQLRDGGSPATSLKRQRGGGFPRRVVAYSGRRRASSALIVLAAFSILSAFSPGVLADNANCSDAKSALGVARSVEIDASKGGIYGSITRQAKEPSILKPKEVVLTFDDGPMPWITRSILDTLDRFCTKATFFEVGRMALSHPAYSKEILARGHTLGTHTMTHPFGLPRIAEGAAIAEIEAGFAAVATAAGQPIAPFFRFTGLADSAPLISYLRSRGVAAFTVDIVSNDSYIADKRRLVTRTLAAVERQKGGIILFHDIKAATAKALPEILAGLKSRGYSVVHLTAKEPFKPLPEVMAEVSQKRNTLKKRSGPVPFYAAVEPDRSASTGALRGYSKRKASKGKHAERRTGKAQLRGTTTTRHKRAHPAAAVAPRP